MAPLLIWLARTAALTFAATPSDIPLSPPQVDCPVIKVKGAPGPQMSCGCQSVVAGPNGQGPRYFDRSDCYVTTECNGSCIYEDGDDDYELSCLRNLGSACGMSACPPGREPDDSVISQNCISEPECEGICVWKDPDNGDESYGLCGVGYAEP